MEYDKHSVCPWPVSMIRPPDNDTKVEALPYLCFMLKSQDQPILRGKVRKEITIVRQGAHDNVDLHSV